MTTPSTTTKAGRGAPVDVPRCTSCGEEVARVESGSLKFAVRSRIVAVRLKDGVAEMNCPKCGDATDIPLTYRWWRPNK
jgi:predicted RNA-binding Zn-ribbon protein involved in translation (DUF1610 family)